jgi:myo-inositol-1(or 4)-monophosphatase
VEQPVEEIAAVALRAAQAAGRIHLKRFQHISIANKTNFQDLVTEADREAEAAVLKLLSRTFPRHAILAEESGANAQRSEHRWIIDPLDGTTNFAHGFPHFCVSIAYERRGVLQVGVVHDAYRKETFFAQRGRGATLNGKPIAVTRIARLTQALVGTGFPYDQAARREFYLTFWEAMIPKTQGLRRTGAAALDLAWIACGRFDAFWEFGLKPWDVAAGALIVREAGGKATNLDGGRLDLAGGRIAASNGRVHSQLVTALMAAQPHARQREQAVASGINARI